jgi:hypothetical protein
MSEQVDRLFSIYWYRRHLDFASRDLLGLELAPQHRLSLRDWGLNKSINTLFFSRGLGKTIDIAIFFTLICMLYPRIKVVTSAGTGFRGSKLLLLEMERIINGFLSGQDQVEYSKFSLKDPKKALNKDPAYWSLPFKNGSIVYAIPLGITTEGDIVRGLRGHLLGMDESFLIPTRLYQKSLRPMQNVLYEPNKQPNEQTFNNMLISVSTCDYDFRDFHRNFRYYKAILEGKENIGDVEEDDIFKISEKDISLYEFNIDDTYYTVNGKKKFTWGIDYTKIMKERRLPTTDIDVWMSENKNIPMNVQGGYFPFEGIEKGMNIVLNEKRNTFPEPLDSCCAQCILGIDKAPSGDNTGFVVIKAGTYNWADRNPDSCMVANMGRTCPMLGVGRRCNCGKYTQVVYAYEENKMSQQDCIKKIYELLDRYNIIAIAMDARGGGLELSDLLKDADYIHHKIGVEYRPIYDPGHDSNVDGIPILKMYSTTQDMNMQMNGYLKGLISNQALLFPRPIRERPDNIRILESAGHIETLVNQVARIKGVPAGKGLKFEIENIDPDTGRKIPGKKDIYSALVLAVGKMRSLIEDKINEESMENINLPNPRAFNI